MKKLPIRFHTVYITVTMLISFFGPRVYENYNKLIVFVFIVFYLMIVNYGFALGIKSNIKVTKSLKRENKGLKILNWFLYCSIFLYIIQAIYLYKNSQLSLNISNMGTNYISFYENYDDSKDGSAFSFELLMLILNSIPKFICLALGFFYYKKLPTKLRVLFFVLLFLIILTQTISTGNQKSLGDIFIFGMFAFLVKGYLYIKTHKLKIIVVSVFVFSFILAIFSYSQYSRLESRDISTIEINGLVGSYSRYDLTHPLFSIFGDKVAMGIAVFTTGYLSGGYYGLSKCLELPFVWTYGIGNSLSISRIFEKFTGIEILKKTYLFRMEKKYDIPGLSQWHTCFPWLASDLTFLGTLLFFFPISFLYGKSWREAVEYNNPLSFLMFCLLTVMFIFVPANNQIFMGYDYICISFFLFIWWIFGHKKYNFQ